MDATSASPMVLLAKSNTSARRGPSLEKVNNPCWSFAKDSYRFGDACKYLHNGVHGKSTLLPCTVGSASSVPDVQGEPPAVNQKAYEPPAVDNRPPAVVTSSDTEPPVGITQPYPYWNPQKNQAITVDLHKWAAQIIRTKYLET
uniref:Uncharacterized protein n=1 Tax=Tanacetum cinerariifolium TaxID=118510 RepID=A0A699LDW7_TANCI|nr:hypothetical protein [Tanacetum cinerariifolium]